EFVFVARACSLRHGRAGYVSDYAQLLAHPVFDLEPHFGVLFKVFAYVVFTLPDTGAIVAVPCTGFIDDTGLYAQVDDFAFARNARAIHDVEFGLLERRRHLVLDDLDPGLVAHDLVALFDGANAADVEAHRRIELKGIT